MIMDAVEYFAAVEARLDPPRHLSREDMVILALVEKRRTPGFCCACGVQLTDKGQNSRWCDECQYAHGLFRENAKYHPRIMLGECKCCGITYRKNAGNQKYCAECKVLVKREQARDGMRRKHGWRQGRECVDCGVDISWRPGAKRCLDCAREHTLKYNREYMRKYNGRFKDTSMVSEAAA